LFLLLDLIGTGLTTKVHSGLSYPNLHQLSAGYVSSSVWSSQTVLPRQITLAIQAWVEGPGAAPPGRTPHAPHRGRICHTL